MFFRSDEIVLNFMPMKTTARPIAMVLSLVCIALAPQARASCQEGCDSSFNTYLGEDALINNIGGLTNTAIGGLRSTLESAIASSNHSILSKGWEKEVSE